MAGPDDYCPRRECAATVGNYSRTAGWASAAADVEIDLAAATATAVGLVVVVDQAAADASYLETEA